VVLKLPRDCGESHLHYLTASTCRRARRGPQTSNNDVCATLPKSTQFWKAKFASGETIHDFRKTLLKPGQEFFVFEVVAPGHVAVLIELKP